MKRILKTSVLCLPLFMILLLGGCSQKTTYVTYARSTDGMETTITYQARGDVVMKQTTKVVLLYSAINVSDEAGAREKFDALSEQFQGIKGVKEEIKYSKESLVETLIIDYKKADLVELKDLPNSVIEGDLSGEISLKHCLDRLEEAGFHKVKYQVKRY